MQWLDVNAGTGRTYPIPEKDGVGQWQNIKVGVTLNKTLYPGVAGPPATYNQIAYQNAANQAFSVGVQQVDLAGNAVPNGYGKTFQGTMAAGKCELTTSQATQNAAGVGFAAYKGIPSGIYKVQVVVAVTVTEPPPAPNAPPFNPITNRNATIVGTVTVP